MLKGVESFFGELQKRMKWREQCKEDDEQRGMELNKEGERRTQLKVPLDDWWTYCSVREGPLFVFTTGTFASIGCLYKEIVC